MFVIYYIVSGIYMEILQFLLSFFLEEYGGQDFEPLLNAFKENSFDVKKVLSSIDPKDILPVVMKFMNSFGKNESPTENPVGQSYGTAPISDVADKEIVDILNNYYSSPSV